MSSILASRDNPDGAAVASHYKKIILRRFILAGVLLLLILLSLLLDFTLGPSGISVATLWHTLFDAASADAGTRVIVWDLRLPFALMAVVVGLALGLAGAEMQTILNNPLASPFTLGVSSAASFGAALAIILGVGIPGIPDQWFISVNAFVFALMAWLYSRRYQSVDARCHFRRGAVWHCAGIHVQCIDFDSAVCRERRHVTGAGVLDDGQPGPRVVGQTGDSGRGAADRCPTLAEKRVEAHRPAPG